MELHQLRYFLAIVDEGTFTAAAQAVHISQSGISTQLRTLERELGVDLVDRTSRRVHLTPAGERLVPSARAVTTAADDLRAAASDIRGLVTGSVRVATVTGPVWPALFDAIAAVHARHPGIDLRLHEGASTDLIDEVRDGAADVAIVAWAGREPEGVRSAVVVDDPLVAVVSPDHPWASREDVEPEELPGAALISLPQGTGARTALDAVFSRLGTSRARPRWEVSSPGSVQMLASRGTGVGVVSATTARGWDGVALVPLRDPRARSRFGVVWRDRPSPAAQALLRLLLPLEDDGRA